ncbi:MAG: divalent-cation tolerance protein CutA [Pseudomonadota bacterium]
MSVILIYMTASPREVDDLCAALLERKLIACANIMAPHKAIYRWEGRVESENECAVILKTTQEKFAELEKAVVELHSYDTPCLLQIDITDAHEPFLKWIGEQVAD